jgi:inosine-uridine nucleoside N-ribohydrolase
VADDAPVHLLVDCDPGIDDALALAVVAHHVRAGRAVLHGIVAVGGNVGLGHTAANAAFLADRFGLDVPVLAGAAVPLAGVVPGDAVEVHGSDGIGGLREPGWVPPDPAGPADLVELARSLPSDRSQGERVLLATGPLTNLARMLQVAPDLDGRVDRIVVMGGAFGDPPGNVTPDAEFNAWVDPEAWAEVAAAGIPLDVVPLDVTTKVVLGRADVASLEEAAGGPTLVSRLVAAGIGLYELLRDQPICEMHDPLAAALVVEPMLVGWEAADVEVELDGPARGQTRRTEAAVGGSTTARVALRVDVEAARAARGAALREVRV